jgi:hypothetical protein
MMDLGRSSLDGRNSGKWDAYLGKIAWFLYSGSHRHMTGARDLFERFIEFDSGMYVELGMGTRHAVQGSGKMSFRMESGDVLRLTNVLCVPELRRNVLSVSTIEKKVHVFLFRDGQVLFMPRGSSSDIAE